MVNDFLLGLSVEDIVGFEQLRDCLIELLFVGVPERIDALHRIDYALI